MPWHRLWLFPNLGIGHSEEAEGRGAGSGGENSNSSPLLPAPLLLPGSPFPIRSINVLYTLFLTASGVIAAYCSGVRMPNLTLTCLGIIFN